MGWMDGWMEEGEGGGGSTAAKAALTLFTSDSKEHQLLTRERRRLSAIPIGGAMGPNCELISGY